MIRMIFRNLQAMWRRYPVSVTLNFAGLVLAFAAFVLVSVHLSFEDGFDRCHPTSARVFRIDRPDEESVFRTVLPPAFVRDVVASSPHVEAGTVYCPFAPDIYFSVGDETGTGAGKQTGYVERMVPVSPDFLRVFGVRMTEGGADALAQPESVVIPESMARRLFGDGPASGQLLHLASKSFFLRSLELRVSGVYRDFPANTQLENCIYVSTPEPFGGYGASNYIGYVLLDDPAAAGAVAEAFNAQFDFAAHPDLSPVRLVPLTEIYYADEGADPSIVRSGSRSERRVLLAVAVLILVIGTVNFVNFQTALVPVRMRSILTQRVLGASPRVLRRVLEVEGTLLGAIAWGLAVLLAGPLSRLMCTYGVLEVPFSVRDFPGLTGLSLLTALAAGWLSAFYSSRRLTRQAPAEALKGGFGLSLSGRRLRRTLVALQYAITVGISVILGYVGSQNRFMREYDPGFDRDRLAVAELSGQHYFERHDWIRQRLGQCPGIEGVAFAMEAVGAKDTYATTTLEIEGEPVMAFEIYCSWDFLQVAGIPVIRGRDFLPADAGHFARITGGAGLERFGLRSLPGVGTVVGNTAPVRFSSGRKVQLPVLYTVVGPDDLFTLPVLYLRMAEGADRETVLSDVREILREMDPLYPFEVRTYDGILEQVYAQEDRYWDVVRIFSLLAVLLTLTGLFAQVMLDVQYRRREIAVRRVFGASAGDVLAEGGRSYLPVVLLGFLPAAPLAGWLSREWLTRFPERVPDPWWVYPAVLAAVSLLTAAVVAWQYGTALSGNPKESLRSE